jgi:16S rRNA (guanine(1405)-N(7))-methyltransferase
MPWAENATYYACDIYTDMVAFLAQALPLLGVSCQVWAGDVLAEPPPQPVDLALVLKTLPCLEQVDKNAAPRLLQGLHARYVLVSFPAYSLGGKQKGMVEHYTTRFESLLGELGWGYRRHAFRTELAYLVTKP